MARLRRGTAPRPAPAGDLTGLPAPVRRYLLAVLGEPSRPVRLARLTQRGDFLAREAPDGWRPFVAAEHIATHPPGFLWDARIRMAPGLAVRVRDGLVEARGSTLAAVAGLWPIVSAAGTPEVASGALHRYLAEAVWAPTAFLPSHGVRWAPLDETSARATLTAGATTVSLDFHFGADGLVSRVFTPARSRDVRGRAVPTPWHGRFSRYEARDGMRIPLAGEVEWLLPDGPRPYWRGEITGAAFERW